MEPVFILMVIFAPFFYWLKRRYDLKEKQLQGGRGDDSEKLIEGFQKERALLLERIENLETIVCQSDYELNMRIAQLVAGVSPDDGDGDGDGDAARLLSAASEVRAASGADEAERGDDSLQSATLTAAGAGAAGEQASVVRAAVAAPSEMKSGHILAKRYRVERLLGRGGMGAVYLAHDEVLNEEVALKVISAAWHHDQRALIERFRREVSAARKVSSPHVIRIHDLGEAEGGLLYISMEYFAGSTLGEVVAARGVLKHRDLSDILGQICRGLQAAHAADVIHRDLKPQNVLVGAQNDVKVIDFGLAKSGFMNGITATGLLLGTPYYMSPEQVRGKHIDARSDIYSLGALAYFIVTGQPPFEGENPIAVSFAHLSEDPVSPRQRNPNVSRDLDRVIMAALSKDPRDRPASASAFEEAL